MIKAVIGIVKSAPYGNHLRKLFYLFSLKTSIESEKCPKGKAVCSNYPHLSGSGGNQGIHLGNYFSSFPFVSWHLLANCYITRGASYPQSSHRPRRVSTEKRGRDAAQKRYILRINHANLIKIIRKTFIVSGWVFSFIYYIFFWGGGGDVKLM